MVKSRKGGQGAESPEEGPAMQTAGARKGQGGKGEEAEPCNTGGSHLDEEGKKMVQEEVTYCTKAKTQKD